MFTVLEWGVNSRLESQPIKAYGGFADSDSAYGFAINKLVSKGDTVAQMVVDGPYVSESTGNPTFSIVPIV